LRLGHTLPAAAHALQGARRFAVLPLVAAALLAGACRGNGDDDDDADAPPPAAVTPPPADAGSDAAPAAAAPAPAAPMTAEDSIREARDDSIALAKDYHQRLGSMESYASCIQKTKNADPQIRPTLEAACKRSRGAPR
jgi:hypothetical protein